MSITDRLLDAITRFSEKIAVSDHIRQLKYAEAGVAAHKIARHLKNLNLKDECIGIQIGDPIDHLLAILGVLFSGNYYFSITSENLRAVQNGLILPVKYILTGIEKDGLIPDVTDDTNIFNKAPDKNFCAFLTSGSTALPKVVVHTHRVILEDTLRQIEANGITGNDKIDLVFSYSFSASLACIFPAFFTGAELCIFDSSTQGIDLLVPFWLDKSVTFSTLSVTSFRTICHLHYSLKNLEKMRFLCIGAEPVCEKDIQAFIEKFPADTLLQVAYATTETRTISEYTISGTNNDPVCFTSVGLPVRNRLVRILSEAGDDLEPGDIGEIVVESEYISDGYYDDPAGTDLSFSRNGRLISFHTGDLGFKNPEGWLFYAGRKHQEVKLNGIKINLSLIEQTIANHCNLQKAVVVINSSLPGRKLLVAFLESGSFFPEDQVRSKIKNHLASSHLPSLYIRVDSFPLTHSGKIDRKPLELFPVMNHLAESDLRHDGDNTLEFSIVQSWNRVLNIQHTTSGSDYFDDLGGDSLNSLVCIHEMEKVLNMNLPANVLLHYRTPRELANFLANRESHAIIRHVQLTPAIAGRKNLFFISHYNPGNTLDPLLHSSLSVEYNISVIIYDMDAGCRNEDGPSLVLEKICNFLSSVKEVIIAGYSFNGYMAHQVASVCDQVVGCILFDTPDYFDYGPYLTDRVYQVVPGVIKSIWIDRDYSLPWFLLQEKAKNIFREMKTPSVQAAVLPDSRFVDGVNFLVNHLQARVAGTSCIFIKCKRSFPLNFNHGHTWKSHFAGSFRMMVLEGRHEDVFNQHHAREISEFIAQGI
jgi:acyl-CoA synthetase (AMP-forming)/AMP-acid ligase II/acyl carrier protein